MCQQSWHNATMAPIFYRRDCSDQRGLLHQRVLPHQQEYSTPTAATTHQRVLLHQRASHLTNGCHTRVSASQRGVPAHTGGVDGESAEHGERGGTQHTRREYTQAGVDWRRGRCIMRTAGIC